MIFFFLDTFRLNIFFHTNLLLIITNKIKYSYTNILAAS